MNQAASDVRELGTGCLAASMHLYLAPDGDVRACCRNWEPLGNLAIDRLPDIWAGAVRQELVERLRRNDFSMGCQQCDAEVVVEGREQSYRANFDRFAPLPEGTQWPMRMEFNLSNACNLQCVQCNGFLSSSIRTHRDHLPPLPKVYGERFFEDLRSFIPHLREAQFAGGEPLLASENFRVWDLIEELSPGLPCTVVTNATQWSPRIERLFETHRMGFAFSIDGATKETYEAIRIGSDFDEVLHNIDRYAEHARRSGMTASINFCLMAQNFRELPAMLTFAEQRDLSVDVSVVRSPSHSSVAHLRGDEIRDGLQQLLRHDDEMRALRLNGATWVRELRRIEHWAAVSDEERAAAWWDTPPDLEGVSPVEVRTRMQHAERRRERVLEFPAMGTGPTDDTEVRAELGASGPVLALTVVEAAGRVVECDAELLEVLGVEADELIGRELPRLMELLTRRYGEPTEYDRISRSDDRSDIRVQFGGLGVHCTLVPLRDDSGWADSARALLVLAPS